MSDWLDDIAARTSVDPTKAQAILSRYGVAPTPSPARPRRLTLLAVRFSGVKQLEDLEVPFEFVWDLAPGVWAVASHEEDNLVGKSSVLEVIRWGLTGRAHLQPDVRAWLQQVHIRGVVNDEEFLIDFDVHDGRPDGSISTIRPVKHAIGSFTNEREFEALIGAFMLDRLGMEPTPFWQNRQHQKEGDPQLISWPGYFSVLYLPDSSHKGLLGTDSWFGQAADFLRVFIGMPWGRTYSTARVALNAESQENRAIERRRQDDEAARQASVREVESRLEELKANLPPVEDATSMVVALDRAVEIVGALAERLILARQRGVAARAALRELQQVLRQDRLRLQDASESALLRRFFHGLNPNVCPRCDTPINASRRESESLKAACAVCTAPVELENADDDVAATLRSNLESLETEETRLIKAEQQALEAQAVAERQLEQAQAEVRSLADRRDVFHRRHLAELEVAKLEAVLEDRRHARAGQIGSADLEAELVLKAAQAEAQQRMNLSRVSLFEALNSEILDLGRAFGVDALEAVRLDGAARLQIRKGGVSTWFSALTRGERLRMKLAVVIAMLRLGERAGVGRHPGLLLIDSPGAEETGGGDFTRIFGELQKIASELPHIQVITATTRGEVVRTVLTEHHVRIAPQGGVLW